MVDIVPQSVRHVKANDLRCDSQDIYHLESNEDHEWSMITSSNARIKPGTVMIVPFNTAIASIAVVAPRDGDHLTVEA